MYAKLVLTENSKRRYERINEFDLELYAHAERLLADNSDKIILPVGQLEAGYNTRQALSWGFRTWR